MSRDDRGETLAKCKAAGMKTAAIAYPHNAAFKDVIDCRAEGHSDTELAWDQILGWVRSLE